MRLPRRALIDPGFDRCDLLWSKRVPRIRRRHAEAGLVGADTQIQTALARVARNDQAGFREGARFCVQTQIRQTLLRVGAVTRKTVVGEDGTDCTVEVDLAVRARTVADQGCGQ